MLPRADAPDVGLPRWFWWLPAVVFAAWFPIAPFWASDDYFALHWAKDLEHVLADFTGPWYGATDLFFFYRPLITLSLWLEVQVAGSDPWLAHINNVLVHACSATMVALLWRRWLSIGYAFAAGLVWGLSPIHIGAIGWAIARTDGFSCAFALMSTLLLARYVEGSTTRRWPSLVCFALALLCKETVLCLPGLLFLVAFAKQDPAAITPRAKRALSAIWPHIALLIAYVAWRVAILGRMGGYDAAAYEPLQMAAGLSEYALGLLNPLYWSPPPERIELLPRVLHLALAPLGFAPALLAVTVLLGKGRAKTLGFAVAWFLLASVPMAGFFAQADNHHNLRYFCLAFAGLAALLVTGGRVATALALTCTLLMLVRVRVEQHDADMQSRSMHEQLVSLLDDDLPGPWFVAGLPHQSQNAVALQFHFGIDRMLTPPFANGTTRVFAHRPTFALPGAVDLTDEDGLPIAPPMGTTLLFRGSELLVTVPQKPLPELPLDAPTEVDATSPALYRLNNGSGPVRFTMPGVRTPALRLTFFTASGYLGALVPNHAAADEQDGRLDLLTFFKTAQWSAGRELIRGLEPSTIMDLATDFPVLIEGGDYRDDTFTPTHRARRMVMFRFDRGLPKVMRGGD